MAIGAFLADCLRLGQSSTQLEVLNPAWVLDPVSSTPFSRWLLLSSAPLNHHQHYYLASPQHAVSVPPVVPVSLVPCSPGAGRLNRALPHRHNRRRHRRPQHSPLPTSSHHLALLPTLCLLLLLLLFLQPQVHPHPLPLPSPHQHNNNYL